MSKNRTTSVHDLGDSMARITVEPDSDSVMVVAVTPAGEGYPAQSIWLGCNSYDRGSRERMQAFAEAIVKAVASLPKHDEEEEKGEG